MQNDFLAELAAISPRMRERVEMFQTMTEEQKMIYFSEEVEVDDADYVGTTATLDAGRG